MFCLAFIAALAAAHGGEVITLDKGQVCSNVKIMQHYARPVTVKADGATIRGMRITGGNIIWHGGTIMAPDGPVAIGGPGYGVAIIGGSDVTIRGAAITLSRKGVVLDRAQRVTITGNNFVNQGEDGIIVAHTSFLTVTNNHFSGTQLHPSMCTVAGRVTYSLPKRDCPGSWVDGTHPDAVQMFDGVTDVLIAGNVVRGPTQGLTHMGHGAPLERVLIRNNDVMTTTFYHQITLYNCIDCRIENNRVGHDPTSTKKALIRPGTAMRCGNIVADEKVADKPCAAQGLRPSNLSHQS